MQYTIVSFLHTTASSEDTTRDKMIDDMLLGVIRATEVDEEECYMKDKKMNTQHVASVGSKIRRKTARTFTNIHVHGNGAGRCRLIDIILVILACI